MKIKYAFAALALSSAFVMPSAFADTAPVQTIALTDTSITDPGTLTGFFGGSHSGTGSFMDTFNFTPTFLSGTATSLLGSVSFKSVSGLSLTSASLNGVDFDLTSNLKNGYTRYTLESFGQFVEGPLQLIVKGAAFGPSASYSGSVFVSNVMDSPSVVPEPETYAMMLAGLGLLGFAARRKAKANQA